MDTTRNRQRLADMFDISAPIILHRHYPAQYVAMLAILDARAVREVAEQVRVTRIQNSSIPRPSWIPSLTKQGKDKLRFRGADILAWQDQIAGDAPSSTVPEPRKREIRLPKRAKRQAVGSAT